MKNYVKFRISEETFNGGSEKAFPLTIDNGRWGWQPAWKYEHIWIPRSQCEVVSEPNEFGWMEILIPQWVFLSKRHDPSEIMEGHYDGIVRI